MPPDITNAILGGLLIGGASILLMLFNGNIAGISGIFFNTPIRTIQKNYHNLAFLFGLLSGGFFMYQWRPEWFVWDIERSHFTMIVAGLLVGIGTRIGSGCTSGHGVCGIGRLSPRSTAATISFMVTGILSVWIINHFLGGIL